MQAHAEARRRGEKKTSTSEYLRVSASPREYSDLPSSYRHRHCHHRRNRRSQCRLTRSREERGEKENFCF